MDQLNPIPTLIKRTKAGIAVDWQDGHSATYSYAYLRRQCPCATCREHPPKVVTEDNPLKLIDDNPIYADSAELVGHYAVQFLWNDGHSTGIYSFAYLRGICPCSECVAEKSAGGEGQDADPAATPTD